MSSCVRRSANSAEWGCKKAANRQKRKAQAASQRDQRDSEEASIPSGANAGLGRVTGIVPDLVHAPDWELGSSACGLLIVAALIAGEVGGDRLAVDRVGNVELRGIELFVFGRRLLDHAALRHLRLGRRPGTEHVDLSQEKGQAHDDEESADDEIGYADELKNAASFSAHRVFSYLF
jgi:hypothetical protein